MNRQRIYLVGLMGAGKTTIGDRLAKRLGMAFFDTDQMLVERTGVSISTIFEIESEAGFRQRETQVLRDLASWQAVVLATGGGIVLSEENRKILHETGWVVYLNLPPSVLYERVRYDRCRPLLQVENPLEKLEALYVLRDPLYRSTAHWVLDTLDMSAEAVSQRIIREYRWQFSEQSNEQRGKDSDGHKNLTS